MNFKNHFQENMKYLKEKENQSIQRSSSNFLTLDVTDITLWNGHTNFRVFILNIFVDIIIE